MSAETAVYALLTGAGAVTAIVGTRIYPVVLPEGISLPAIVYTQISAVRLPKLDAFATTHLTRSRVQVDLMAKDFAALVTLRNAAVAALQFQRGVIAATTVHSVLHGGEGLTSHDPELEIFHRPIDVIVTHEQ